MREFDAGRHDRDTTKMILVLTAAILMLGTTESTAQDLSETLAELNTLGLRVELRAGQAPIVSEPPPAPAGAPAPPVAAGQSPVVDFWNALTNGLDDMLRRNAEDTRNDIIRAIRDACRLNITEDGEGFQLQFVAVSLGGFVTATFAPTPRFCSQMPDGEIG